MMLPASAGLGGTGGPTGGSTLRGTGFTALMELTSDSSCSRNCRAMWRARPTQRPICCTRPGSFLGPSTTSASPKMMASSLMLKSKKPRSRARAAGARLLLGIGLAIPALFGGQHFGEFRIRLSLRRALWLRLLEPLAEALDCGTEVGPGAAHFARAEHQQQH